MKSPTYTIARSTNRGPGISFVTSTLLGHRRRLSDYIFISILLKNSI